MRRVLASAIALSILAFPIAAEAGHKPNVYCSETGDICQSTTKVDGVRKLRISTAEKYFGKYKLCVTAPDGSTKCGEFRMYENGPIWTGSVRWAKHFPHKGKGAYTVRWRPIEGPGQYGRRLGFHI